jgi:hypothetical protein
MSRIQDIKDELDNDPLTRGYAGMTSVEVAEDLNTKYRSRIKASMSGDEIAQSVNSTEYEALTDTQKELLLTLTSRGELDPKSGGFAHMVLVDLFGAGSTTIASLSSNRNESISRAEEINITRIRPGEIEEARNL